MAAPTEMRISTSVPKTHFPLHVSSDASKYDSTDIGSSLNFIGSNNDPLYTCERNSHGFSCSNPLPILFKYDTQSGKEKKNLKTDVAKKGTYDNMYTNSCLAYIPRDKHSGCLILPSGPTFKEIKICSIFHKQGNCIDVRNTTIMDVDSTVCGLSCQRTQGQDFIVIQTDKRCYLCRLEMDNSGSYNLSLEFFIPDHHSSVNLSPYIPKEACVASKSGDLHLWQEEKLEKVYVNPTPKQADQDTWSNVHFGSHPRCLIYSDQTTIQLYDTRCSSLKMVPLFSSEDLGRDRKDLFRVCQNSSLSSFYHTMATDHCLCLLDERFPKIPVLRTSHMLQSVPGYITEFSDYGDTHVYLGSFSQPVIHQVSMRSCDNYPLQILGLPYRIPKKSELLGEPDIGLKHSKLIMDKLSSPLWGLQTIQYDNGHAVLQLDRNGEVFYQMFKEKGLKSETNIMGDNSEQSDTFIIPGAVQQSRAWINKWKSTTQEKHKKNPDKTSDISTFISGLADGFPGFMACPLCMSQISEVLDINKYSDVVCPSCQNQVSEAWALKRAAGNDGIVPTKDPTIPIRNPEIFEAQEKWNSLSHVLYSSWYEETGADSSWDNMREDDQG